MSDFRQQLQDHIEEEGLTQAAIGKAIGYSGSVISQYLDGTYGTKEVGGDLKAVETAVEQYLALALERKAEPKVKIPYVQIAAAKKVYDFSRSAHRDGEICVITGDPGLGKTKALEHYQSKYSKKVAYLLAYKGLNVRTLVSKLHMAFFGGAGNGNKSDMIEELCTKLKDANRCIIIDQAEYLNLTALETLRHIHDASECGMVLAGTHKLHENLRGRNKSLAQLWSRVRRAVRLDRLTAEDVEKIIHAAMPEANGVWKAYHQHCNGNGRLLETFIWRTKRVAGRNKAAITEELVARVARQHKEALGIS